MKSETLQETGFLPREVVGSKAFNLEYLPQNLSDKSLRQDIVSYLGEYRFKIPKFNYGLSLVCDETGGQRICDPNEKEPMVTKAYRSIQERRMRGDPTHREEHELLGLMRLESQLRNANDEAIIIWASPPGPKEEGYGDYGFIYKGKIEGSLGNKKISMTAVRVENPTINQFNRTLSKIVNRGININSADDFLSSPIVSERNISEEEFDAVLRQEFSFEEKEEEQERFSEIIKFVEPLIERLIFSIKYGTKNEKTRNFYALENYVISLREGQSSKNAKREYAAPDIDRIVNVYGAYQPPVAKGSCGSTGGSVSNMLFGSMSEMTRAGGLLDSREPFTCPKCSYTTHKPVGNQCPGCGLTKEQYAEESGMACD
jgi:hypothetical protein